MSKWGKVKHWLAYRNWDKINKIFCSKFQNMIQRCNNPIWKNKNYEWIHVERKDLTEFKNDMYESYIEHVNKFWLKNTTIDRINPKWNYCKENCRWATCKEQNYNRENTLSIEIDWIKYTSDTFAKKYWISVELASSRISKYLKWKRTMESICKYWQYTNEDKSIISTKYIIDIDWKKYTTSELAKKIWISTGWIRSRYKLYEKWKISKDELLNKEHRPTVKHSVLCIIDWIEYNKDTLAKVVWCNKVTARTRIKKYNEWLITKEQLFQKTFIWKNTY